MKRGDIVTVAGGVYASKPRPALVIQDDLFVGTDSVTVCPVTATEIDAPLLRIPVVADSSNGLSHDCHLMIDKITTVRRTNCHVVLGVLDPAILVSFERRMLVFLGIGG